MRTDIPSGLQDHLDTRETTLCWCWKITRIDGLVLGFTNHDRDLTFDSATYEASTGFLGTEIESQLGMNVDNMDVYGAVDSDNIREADIEAGLFDNADIEVYLVNWQDVSERVIMKKGNLGEVKRGKTMFQTEVRGISNQLQQVKGRVYQYTCDALLGDSRCRKSLSGSTYTGTGSVASTNGYSSLVASGLDSYQTGWFSRGKITFTSGNNNGIVREVKAHIKSEGVISISLWEPLPFELEESDTFSITAGCDKTFKTCKAKFDNADNFRGFPHIPGSSTVIRYANIGDPNFDGGGNFVGKD
jgi:uncharacterized phage protein (TIGR02218 family)